MPTQAEIREQVTRRIVDALKADTAPWRRPWSPLENTGSPANVVSRRRYSGVNTLLLELVAQERGYSSRWWGTFRQWQQLGLRVKARPSHVNPGEWGTKIVFCKVVAKKPAHERDVEDQ
jgi:antirestriction protein ArdC